MDRRDFIKTVGVAGTLATGWSAVGAGLGASAASADAHAGGGDVSGSVARAAMKALLDAVDEDVSFLVAEGFHRAEIRALAGGQREHQGEAEGQS